MLNFGSPCRWCFGVHVSAALAATKHMTDSHESGGSMTRLKAPLDSAAVPAHDRGTWGGFGIWQARLPPHGLCGASTARRHPAIHRNTKLYKGLRSGCHAAPSHLPRLDLRFRGLTDGFRTSELHRISAELKPGFF